MNNTNDANDKPKKRSTLRERMNDATGIQLIKKGDPRHSQYQKDQQAQTSKKQEKPKR